MTDRKTHGAGRGAWMPSFPQTAVSVAIVLLVGCAGYQTKQGAGGIVQGVQGAFAGKHKVSSQLTDQPPRLVAVMPFENLTGKTAKEEEKGADFVVRSSFANHFTTRRYETQRTIVTDRLLQEKGVFKAEDAAQLPLKMIGEITKADSVIYGQITHFDRIYVGVYSQIAVGAKLKWVDVKSGEVLWEAEDVSRKHSGGFATEPLGLIIALASNAYALRHIEVVRASEELFRDMVDTIPKARIGEAVRPPTITLLVNDSATLTRKAGDVIKVGIQGEPNMLATFDLGQYKPGVVMQEVQPGIYTGSYTVKPGDNGENLLVVGHLSDRKGLATDWEDALGPVTLDTMPPAIPAGLSAIGRDKAVSLSWKPNAEKDLAGYRVYRSATALTGFASVTATEVPTFLDAKELVNQQRYYYKITAFDRVGNESAQTDAFSGVPVPPGPTPVQGIISLNATWFAGASPYVIEGDVTVAQGATLAIEPGTVVQSKGAGLVVKGALLAKGTPEQIIVLTADPAATSGQWQGVTFDHTGAQDSVLEQVRVTKAIIGVRCEAASPKIVHSELSDNGTGLLARHATAKPVVEQNQIVLNRDDGVAVQEAAAPVLTGNRIAQNKGAGLSASKTPGLTVRGNTFAGNESAHVRVSGGGVVDVSGNWWGTTEGVAVVAKLFGPVLIKDLLDGQEPTVKSVLLPVLDSQLGGMLSSSSFLLVAKSPYLVTRPVIIDNDATLAIQPGVVIRFKAGDTSIVVRHGAIQALGTKAHPVVMTSANTSPRPGDYASAVQFEGGGQQPSLLRHVRIEYAAIAVQVKEGNPEISHALIAHNLQSALECGGKSAPKVTYSTLTEHPNNAAVICSGRAQPTLYRNNIVKNAWGVINHSTLPLEARENWWGAPLDDRLFLGAVEYKPALSQPEPEAVP